MNTYFEVKNFRIFDSEGATIRINPITIFTGCNNSGKSSIVKALCLLKEFSRCIESDYADGRNLRLSTYKIDFHKHPYDLLGTFDNVLHRDSTNQQVEINHDNKFVTFEVLVESKILLQELILHLDFSTNEWDDLNNAYLFSYSIRTLDGKKIYSADRNKNASMNFSVVKKQLLHFLYGQYAFARWQNECVYRSAMMYEPAGEDKERQNLEDVIANTIEKLGSAEVVRFLEYQVAHCHYTWKDGSSGPGATILNCVDSSFLVDSPNSNIFCYFPCLKELESIKKDELRDSLQKLIASKQFVMDGINEKVLDLFISAYEDSEEVCLSQFLEQKENERFFIDEKVSGLGGESFVFPDTFWKQEICCSFYDENDLPEKANWSVVLLAMDLINKLITGEEKSLLSYDEVNECHHYFLEHILTGLFRNIIEEIFVNMLPGDLAYSATTMLLPKRMYSIEEDNELANSLKKYFETKRVLLSSDLDKFIGNRKIEYKPCSFIDKWMCQLGIAYHVEIKSHAGGYGVTIQLYENESDTNGMALVDKGFGVLQLFVILLKVENAIMESLISKNRYTYYTEGLSKEIAEILRSHNQLHPITLALEEPESHLHPSLQSQLAEIIVDAYNEYGIHFIVESHSEYMIRKLQLMVSENLVNNDNVSLLYLNSSDRPKHLPLVMDIGMNADGTLKNEFGNGFFDEAIRLSKDLFKNNLSGHEE